MAKAVVAVSGLCMLRSGTGIDLLVTDVSLPGRMSGRQLADASRQIWAGLKVLSITGYAQNAAISHGILEPDMAMLSKPFAPDGSEATRMPS